MHVDDDLDMLEIVKTILERAGYEVISVSSGLKCLDKLKEVKPDLVLLDIMLPDLSGWDVYTRIRKKDKKLKVAFFSIVEVSPERKSELILRGLSDYITKPFAKDELVKRVKAMVNR